MIVAGFVAAEVARLASGWRRVTHRGTKSMFEVFILSCESRVLFQVASRVRLSQCGILLESRRARLRRWSFMASWNSLWG